MIAENSRLRTLASETNASRNKLLTDIQAHDDRVQIHHDGVRDHHEDVGKCVSLLWRNTIETIIRYIQLADNHGLDRLELKHELFVGNNWNAHSIVVTAYGTILERNEQPVQKKWKRYEL